MRHELLLLCLMASGVHGADFAIQGEWVYSMAGAPIRQGIVLVKNGKIQAVGPGHVITVPAGYTAIRARIVTPGLIDAHGTVGFSGMLNQPQDQEQLEKSSPMQPELRAVDGYNARDPLVAWVRGLGITTIHTGHAPGALITGQTMIVKTYPDRLDESVLNPSAMIAASLGPAALSSGKDKAPGTAPKAVAMLRAEFLKAGDYLRKMSKDDVDKRPARDLRLEALGWVLEGKKPLLMTVDRHQDILAALRLAAEFKLKIVLDGVADAPLVLNEIKASGFPVLAHPTMARADGVRENLSFETAAKLKRAGLQFALQGGYEAYVPKSRVVLFEAGVAAAHGLTFNEALASVTMDAARVLGIDQRVGSIEPGKDADLALYDGDPFEYTTHCVGVLVSGVLTDSGAR